MSCSAFCILKLTLIIGDFADQRLQSPDTYRRMISKDNRITKKYDICQDGCCMFAVGDSNEKECSECKKPRYENQSQIDADRNDANRNPLMPFINPVPFRQISYTSVLSALTELYADDDMLDILKYGENFLDNEPATNFN